MNTPESESAQPGPSGLHVELGAKRTRRLAIWSVLLIALVAVGSVTLLAWLPDSSPSPTPVPSATPLQSPSKQPRITWSDNQLELILSPGESATRELTFTSDQDIQNPVIEPVSTLAPFVNIHPNRFADVPAGQQQSVKLTFSIPPAATLGTYDGTIHVRSGSQTLPQTLKVLAHVWSRLTDDTFGFTLLFPPTLILLNIDNRWVFSTTGSPAPDEGGSGEEIDLVVHENRAGEQLDPWLRAHVGIDPAMYSAPEVTRGILADGTPYVAILGIAPAGDPDNMQVFVGNSQNIVSLRVAPFSLLQADFETMLRSLRFD